MKSIITSCYSDPSSSDYSPTSSNLRFAHMFTNVDVSKTNVLDYGCGPGNMVEWFIKNQQKPALYYGYDIREETVAIARQKNPSYQFETELCVEPVFDIAVFAGTISYAFDNDIDLCKNVYEQELTKAMDLLRSGGCIKATARKVGYEYERKQNKKMITYAAEELEQMGATNIFSLFEHEWAFDIRRGRTT